MPDKAMNLVDEACAVSKDRLDSMPAELDGNRIVVMQRDRGDGSKETDHLSQDRLAALQKGACRAA